MVGFRLGKLGNDWEQLLLNGGLSPDYDTAVITVVDGNGNPIADAKVEIKQQATVFFTHTDSKGEATMQGKNGESYTMTISGEKIETLVLDNWVFSDATVQVEVKKYLEIRPEYIWLMRSNNYTDSVDVLSNVDWFIQ